MSDLTKWPRLLVLGTPVTQEQANEILIRTCVPAYLRSNDRQWDEIVGRIMGFNLRDDWPRDPALASDSEKRIAWFRELWAARDARAEELGIFGGEYLHTSRISSNWIGGPHGWCDWEGNIFTDSYNIGKWPSTGAVTEEWEQIAREFPFLDLTAQLITDEGEGELAGQWRVKGGAVTYDPEPTQRITPRPGEQEEEDRLKWNMVAILSSALGRERGVSPERLTEAVSQVEQTMRAKRR